MMVLSERDVQRVLVTGADPAGEELAIVEYRDGSFGITRHGEPINPLHWPADGILACTEHFAGLIHIPERWRF